LLGILYIFCAAIAIAVVCATIPFVRSMVALRKTRITTSMWDAAAWWEAFAVKLFAVVLAGVTLRNALVASDMGGRIFWMIAAILLYGGVSLSAEISRSRLQEKLEKSAAKLPEKNISL